MSTTNQSTPRTAMRPRRSPPQRRGVAMMLVVIALAVGTVIAGVALTSRSVAPQLGANAESASKSKWSAQSAADYAVAALQTDLDISAIVDGNMMADAAMAGGTANVVITDLQGNPPAADTREVIVTATSSVNGIPSVVRKRVVLNPPPTAPAAIDPYLSEFALFAQNNLTIDANAGITKWGLSPESKSTAPVKIGTGFAALADLNIHTDARLRDTALYVDGDASVSLQTALNDPRFIDARRIKLDIPARLVKLPTTIASMPWGGVQNFTYTAGTTTIFPDGKKYAGILSVQDGATVILDQAVSPVYSFTGITVNRNAKLVVRGDVDIEVNGAVYVLDKSLVTVEPGGSLDLYVRGNIYTERSSIGADLSVFDASGCNPANLTQYSDPRTVRILAPTLSYPNQNFVVDNRSFVIASVHMPATAFSIINTSVLSGRVSAKTINVASGCKVYADTSLDNRNGFTNLDGPIYDESGNAISAITDLLSGVLAIVFSNKAAEEAAADMNTAVNATIVAPPAPIDGTTARNTRATKVVNVPVIAMVMEKRATITMTDDDDDDDDDDSGKRINFASADDDD